MSTPHFDLVAVVICVIVVIIIIYFGTSKDKFHKFASGNNADYQYDPPSITVQNNYYKGIQDECAGNTYDYNCLEKVHLKSFMGDMVKTPELWDIQTKVCMYSPNVVDEESFYKCLDGTYAGYQYP